MIPWVLITVGGIMILAGVKKENPLEILKSVLTNTPVPGTGKPDVNNPQPTTPGSTKVAR